MMYRKGCRVDDCRTLYTNVTRSSDLLEIGCDEFVAAALRQPPLFSLRPENLKRKRLYLLKISQALVFRP
jgi:hypothetical protein